MILQFLVEELESAGTVLELNGGERKFWRDFHGVLLPSANPTTYELHRRRCPSILFSFSRPNDDGLF